MHNRLLLFLMLLAGSGQLVKAQKMSEERYREVIDSRIAADSLAARSDLPDDEPYTFPGSRPKPRRDEVVKFATHYMGLRYRRGGSTERGFDCSGFTSYVFRNFGVKLPHTSAGQSYYGIEVPRDKITKGDLIFFKGANIRRRSIGHVGIVISERGQPVRFIHSSTSGGIRIDYLDDRYYRLRYVRTRRILME